MQFGCGFARPGAACSPTPAWMVLLKEITYVASSVLYNCLGLGACVTAILSTERCLCVIFPLKVKSIVTARRVKVVIGALVIYETIIAVLVLATTGPPFAKYYANRTSFEAKRKKPGTGRYDKF
ncbi:hypothetical protein ElyMa_006468600 [Elysia marginata]|uniref:G-protein coupled receptors family 1 profile domain-containing protein n=1 Tax=Elysia marginata TaxID=1093978 RepID=A0AAV4I0D7_9GAST|nr:hypothetical protein ElyMa_006468600 [Elysia marginata]